MRAPIVFLLVSILYVGAVFLAVQGKTFRLDSDYDSNLPIISFVVDTIRNERHFPLWNPYVATGISVLGDPLSAVTYMPYLLPMLVFGVPEGLWMVIGIHAFLAGFFMWLFLKEIASPRWAGARNDIQILLWGSLLYMGAGTFAARVAAGHIEKVLSYPWYPLFLLFLLRGQSIAVGAVMGIVFLTGDVYGLLFMVIFIGVIWVIREIRGIGGVIIGFLVVAAIKLVPFLWEVLPVMERYGSFDATRGSIPLWSSWLPFVMPWGVEFYDRQFFQRLFGFWYNWYEYYAFIGLPVVFLIGLPRVIKRREVQILFILLAVGMTYASRGSVYSPWYRLAPLLEWFRAPERIYGSLTSIVIALIVLSVRKNTSWLLLWGMLCATLFISGYQMTRAFEPPRACCTQLHRIREKIHIIDYYYGWIPKPLWENQK